MNGMGWYIAPNGDSEMLFADCLPLYIVLIVMSAAPILRALSSQLALLYQGALIHI